MLICKLNQMFRCKTKVDCHGVIPQRIKIQIYLLQIEEDE